MFTTNKQKILIKFIETEPRDWYSLELARGLKISAGSANTLLKELKKEGYLSSKVIGKTILYSLASENPVVREFKKLLNVGNAVKDLTLIKKEAGKIILFGSRSQGTNLPQSDYDIFVVSDKIGRVRKILMDLKTKEYKDIVMKPEDYLQLKTADPVLYIEIEKGIIIFEK